jgi:hypothetical protein
VRNALPVVRVTPREDRGIGFAQASVITVMRHHRGHPARCFERQHRTYRVECRGGTDAEVDRQLVRARRTIDEDILPVELEGACACSRVHLVQVPPKFLRDTAPPHLRTHTGHLSSSDAHFVYFVRRV